MRSLTAVALLLLSAKLFALELTPPESSTKSVLFLDERYEVQDNTDEEFRAQGQVGPWCTGTLIAPNAVLTAAHCVYNKTKETWYKNLDFSPSDDIARNIKWKQAYIPAKFKRGSLGRYDFAVIILEESIGSEYSPLKMIATDTESEVKEIRISGFPEDWDYKFVEAACENRVQNNERTVYNKYKSMFGAVSEAFIKRVYNKYKDMSFYKCDTSGGMSGAAVRIKSESGAFDTIAAIHTTGNKLKNIRNSGTTITSDVLKTIKLWTKEKSSPHHKESLRTNK